MGKRLAGMADVWTVVNGRLPGTIPMDVEYYGPNPLMEFWYLGALRAAEEIG
jgi:hypothetical protein